MVELRIGAHIDDESERSKRLRRMIDRWYLVPRAPHVWWCINGNTGWSWLQQNTSDAGNTLRKCILDKMAGFDLRRIITGRGFVSISVANEDVPMYSARSDTYIK